MEKNERYKDVVTYLIRKGLASTQGQIAHLLDYKNASHFSQVMKGIKPISDQKLGNIKKLAPEINVNWIKDGTGQMFVSDTVQAMKEDEYQWIEFVDLEIAAGKIGVENPALLPEHKRMLFPKEYEEGKYLVTKVIGRSMEDGIYSIHEGSHILIKEVTDLKLRTEVLKLIDNLYVIVTKEGTVLKQIIEQNQEKGYIVCHSYNKDFKDYKIYFEDIRQIFVYIKVVSAKPPIPNILLIFMEEFTSKLKDIAEYLHIPFYQLIRSTGYSAATAQRLSLRIEEVDLVNVAERIKSTYPEINKQWLLFGKGEMWETDYYKSRFLQIKKRPTDNADLIELLCSAYNMRHSQLAKKTNITRSTIHRISKGEFVTITTPIREKFLKVFPFIPEYWFV